MNTGDYIGITLVLMLVSFIGGCIVVDYVNRHEALKHHAAHYDANTGAFTWNE